MDLNNSEGFQTVFYPIAIDKRVTEQDEFYHLACSVIDRCF
jgi:hypothetical protein